MNDYIKFRKNMPDEEIEKRLAIKKKAGFKCKKVTRTHFILKKEKENG